MIDCRLQQKLSTNFKFPKTLREAQGGELFGKLKRIIWTSSKIFGYPKILGNLKDPLSFPIPKKIKERLISFYS